MAAQRAPDGMPVYLVTPTWCLPHKSIQLPSEQMETSNICLIWHGMKFQSILTPLPKHHHLVFVLDLPPHSSNWYPLFLSWKPANIHSAVTFFLAHNFRDIYSTPSAICLSALKIPTQFCLSPEASCSTIQDPTLHSPLNPVMLYSWYAIFHRQCVEGVYFGVMTFSTILSPPLFLIMYLPLFITTEHKADAFMKHLFKKQFPK